MTTPVLYATISDLRLVLAGTDAGVGTAAQLSDEQLSLALREASSRVSTYFGAVYDSSTPDAVPPPLAEDVTLDLAVWFATTYYLKQKDMPPTSPVQLRYTEAVKVLEDIRSGRVLASVGTAGADIPGGETGHVINGIPAIFTDADSNTEYDPVAGVLVAAVPPDMWQQRQGLLASLQEGQG